MSDYTVIHEADARRFVTYVDEDESYVTYVMRGDEVMALNHTWTPSSLRGRGIAGHVVRAAFEHARAEGLKIEPACPYVAAFTERHPEYGDLLSEGDR